MNPPKNPKRVQPNQSSPTSNDRLRLQRFLAQCGIASRRKAEELIVAGEVKVNGAVANQLGTTIDPTKDIVEIDGRIVKPQARVVLLLYKPRKVVSTMFDPEGRRCIKDLLTPKYRSCFPVGRLDYDSEGLVIITNDGEMAEVLLHPRYEHERLYRVQVAARIEQGALEQLEAGIRLEDGVAKGLIHHVEDRHDGCWVDIMVREGRNRLVRRMFDAIHHPVERLIRLAHGPFRLGTMKPGEIRRLSENDAARYRRQLLPDSEPRQYKKPINPRKK